jgi:hypothetical protein
VERRDGPLPFKACCRVPRETRLMVSPCRLPPRRPASSHSRPALERRQAPPRTTCRAPERRAVPPSSGPHRARRRPLGRSLSIEPTRQSTGLTTLSAPPAHDRSRLDPPWAPRAQPRPVSLRPEAIVRTSARAFDESEAWTSGVASPHPRGTSSVLQASRAPPPSRPFLPRRRNREPRTATAPADTTVSPCCGRSRRRDRVDCHPLRRLARGTNAGLRRHPHRPSGSWADGRPRCRTPHGRAQNRAGDRPSRSTRSPLAPHPSRYGPTARNGRVGCPT